MIPTAERKINLTEIFDKYADIEASAPDYDEYATGGVGCDTALAAMREACRQTLELAAENVRLYDGFSTEDVSHWIDKESILNTINQIEI